MFDNHQFVYQGCFLVKIKSSKTHTIGFQIELRFTITQHERDEQLLKSFVSYLGCGYNVKQKNTNLGNFVVTKISDITEIIIPFFHINPVVGVKEKDFSDFKQVGELMRNKVHLTKVGLDQIRNIKMGMNRQRK
jgi:hypothetical protein